MPELMHYDKQVKQDKDLEQDEDDAGDVQNHVFSGQRSVIGWTRNRFRRWNSFQDITLQLLNVFLRLLPRPLIGCQYCIEIGVRNGRMPVHHLFNNLPDFRKPHFAI